MIIEHPSLAVGKLLDIAHFPKNLPTNRAGWNPSGSRPDSLNGCRSIGTLAQVEG
jgi:hypothetical protein